MCVCVGACVRACVCVAGRHRIGGRGIRAKIIITVRIHLTRKLPGA